MRGKLIIIEAGDGSGKATQVEKLITRLKAENHKALKVTFPDYQSASSALIKMYLHGEFGSNPGDVNPYVASTFYAVDRFASYKKEWEGFYLQGGIVVADRYTTSNMVHQGAKISDDGERDKFLRWLWDLEFEKFKLPEPDAVIFLNMPPELALRLLRQRDNKTTGREEKDIHEKDPGFLLDSYRNSCRLALKYGWHAVDCSREGTLKDVAEIHEEVYALVKRAIQNR